MNIFQIIISKVSATITVILVSMGVYTSPVLVVRDTVEVPVQIVVATTTSLNAKTSSPVIFNPTKPAVVTTTPVVATQTVPTITVVEEEIPTVIIPVVTLPTTNQVAPTQAPQVIIQIQQVEVPVASASIKMEKLYKLTKGEGEGESVVLDNITEQEIRNFAEGLNQQINWRKQTQNAQFSLLITALISNGYFVTEK